MNFKLPQESLQSKTTRQQLANMTAESESGESICSLRSITGLHETYVWEVVAALHRQQSLFTQLHLSPPIRFGYTAFFNQLAFHKMIFLDKVISVIWAVVAGYNRGPYSCNRLYLKSTHNFSLKSYAQPSIMTPVKHPPWAERRILLVYALLSMSQVFIYQSLQLLCCEVEGKLFCIKISNLAFNFWAGCGSTSHYHHPK